MKIGQKLNLGFLGIALLVGIVGFFSITLSRQISKLRTVELPMEQSLREVEVSIWEMIHAADSFRLTGRKFYADLYYKQIGDVNEFYPEYQSLADTDEEKKYIEEFNILWEEAKTAGSKMIDLTEKQKKAEKAFFLNVDEADDVLDLAIKPKWSLNDRELLAKGQAVREVEESIWEAIHAGQRYINLHDDQKHIGGELEATTKTSLAKGDFKVLMEMKFEDVEGFLAKYKALSHADFEDAAIQGFEGLWKKAVVAGREVVSLNDQAGEQFNLLFEKVDKADNVLDFKMQEFIQKRIERHDANAIRVRTITIAISIFAIVGALATGLIIAYSITRPITILRNATDEMSKGKLDTQIEIKSNDEIKELANSFNKMTRDLQNTTVSRDYVESILRNMMDSLVVSAPDGTIQTVNQITLKLLGYTETELIGKPIGIIFAEEEEEEELVLKGTGIEDIIRKGFISNIEKTYLTKDGRKIPVLFSGSVMYEDFESKNLNEYDDVNKIVGIVSIAHDITERKRMEKVLYENEKKYKSLFADAGDALFIMEADQENRAWFVECNQRTLSLFGCEFNDIIGESPALFSPETQPDGKSSMEKAVGLTRLVMEGQPQCFQWLHYRYDNRKSFYVEVNLSQITLQGKSNYMQAVVRDITERKKLEEERIKMQRLESIGLLAGGIAHDFNNYLQGILCNVEIAKNYADSKDKNYAVLSDTERTILQAKDLAQQLLTFSKGGEPVKKEISVSELIKDSEHFALSGTNIRCEFDMPDYYSLVEVDKGQMNQVFSNLFINAHESMPKGGLVKVRVESINDLAKESLPQQERRYVKITIKDHGIGIPQDKLQKIFDPYFTTKQEGSGLGLATTYSIIKKHSGYITVESEMGVGTTFNVYIPISDKEISGVSVPDKAENFCPELAEEKSEDTTSLAGKKILFMDDDSIIRFAIVNQLKRLQCEVENAKDGTEAIALYKKAFDSDKPFDAVILDLTVTRGMGGEKTINELQKMDIDIKAIAASGYSNSPVLNNFREYGFKGMVKKPYGIRELEEVLQQVIMEKEEP